jgi:hypothetical protein
MMRFTQPILLAAMCATLGVLSACSSQPPAPINNATLNAAAPVATPIAPPRSTELVASASLDAANAAAQTTPRSVNTATPETGAAVLVTGSRGGDKSNQLILAQVCEPAASGDQCILAFADTRAGQEPSSQVTAYFQRSTSRPPPKVTVESTCAPGWLASIVSEQGSAQGGGVMQAQAAVCGHPSAGVALTALLNACDGQTQGGCRQSTRVKIAWGRWDGTHPPGREVDIGRPFDAGAFADGQACDSVLPLSESGQCASMSAVQLRLIGLP